MNQKEQMYNENNGGGGAAKPGATTEKNSYWKYIAFGLIFAAMAAGIILTFI